jgi:SAM-dependent methyltransferase
MDRREFDRFADEYQALHRANIAASGEAPEYFAEYKMRDLARVIADFRADAAGRYLDFGTGVGTSVPYFRRHVPAGRLTCVDVSQKSLAIGRANFADAADFVAFDGVRLPFPDATFAGAYAACVFHHIPAGEHPMLLAEIRRVVRPGGCVMVYEHNPWNPLTRRAVDTCPFDENAVLIPARVLRSRLVAAGFTRSAIRYRVFVPGALSRLRAIERRLTWLPLGAQYYVCAAA